MPVTARYSGDLCRHHRWRSGVFTYTISGFSPGSTLAISLGFAKTVILNSSGRSQKMQYYAVSFWWGLSLHAELVSQWGFEEPQEQE
jgi:hypothetical protein